MKYTVFIVFLLMCFKGVAHTVEVPTVGELKLDYDGSNGWNVTTVLKTEGERDFLTLDFSSPSLQVPPRTLISFSVPQIDIYHLWTSGSDNTHLSPDWVGAYVSSLASNMPLYALLNNNDENKLTIACDEVKRHVKTEIGLREEGANVVCKMHFFEQPEAAINHYRVTIMFDRRRCFWADAVREAADWMSRDLHCIIPPDDAWDAFYSSWYNFHQDVSDAAIEAECKQARALGMKTIIVDDGWQTDDNNRGYAYCGDWEVSKTRFPDFAGHVKTVHDMGMKYMLWFSVPWMGEKSKNYERFSGKYLYLDKKLHAAALDPRFPDVRRYLIDKYVKAMQEWGLDGFKLDFIDSFHFRGKDPAIADNYAGRDIKSLPEAVDVLMQDVYKALSAINPEVLVEFRQSYIGPAIRQYGNMMRAADCPANPQDNRIRIAKLRLTSGQTAVHSDMLEWNVNENDENVACSIINSIFGVVQYSAMLRDVSENHKKIIRHYIDFSQMHRQTLLHSKFIPHHPELGYPVVEAVAADERIVGVYSDCAMVDISACSGKAIILNATGRGKVLVKLSSNVRKCTTYDCFGNHVGDYQLASLSEALIPNGGYMVVE